LSAWDRIRNRVPSSLQQCLVHTFTTKLMQYTDDDDNDDDDRRVYLIIEVKLTECRYVFCPLDHDHQLLLHRLTDVLYVSWLLLVDTHRVHSHAHLYTDSISYVTSSVSSLLSRHRQNI